MQFAGVLADCTLSETGEKSSLLQQALVAQLAHSEKLNGITLPEPDVPPARHALADSAPRIVLNDGVVSYNDRPVINHLSWTVNPGEHWQIVGPNGAGKSTLLSLVTGIIRRATATISRSLAAGAAAVRPSGILKSISATSAAACIWTTGSAPTSATSSCRAILTRSAFIRRSPTSSISWCSNGWIFSAIDKRTADAPFHSLSWGQQRLALIVRALVKHPTLLILDEPLQGLDPSTASWCAALSTC